MENMDSPDLTVYVDTNCFIQLRDLQDLPWRDIAPGANKIEIAVPRIVITELDRMKSDTSSDRRRNRSRKALALIKSAIDSPNETVRLGKDSTHITLRICICANLPWEEHPNLDRLSADDNLVLCALAEKIEGKKLLMTLDKGPYLSAKLAGLNALEPPEAWTIPTDHAEVEAITKLQRQLVEAKATKPRIEVDFVCEEQPVKIFDFTSLVVPPLLRRVRETIFSEIYDRNYEESISDETFTSRIRQFLKNLHQEIYDLSRTNAIAIRLSNPSSVTAHNLLSVVRVGDGLTIFDDDDDLGLVLKDLWIPKPEMSQPANMPSHSTRPVLSAQSAEKPRDPTKFYWQTRPKRFHSSYASSLCMEFRARQDFTQRFWISPYSREISSGSVDVEISATNLPGPQRRTTGFRLTEKKSSWSDEEVQNLLPDYIVQRLINC